MTGTQESAGKQAKHTLLVVDDEKSIRDLLSRLLAMLGYTVLAAQSGHEAERVHAVHAPVDLLLCDLVLPDTGGLDLYRRLCKRQAELPVVFISGKDAAEDVQQREKGAFFIQKPFTLDRLSSRVAAALSGNGGCDNPPGG